MADYKIAVYIRLSNADEETGSRKDESNSVIHQRMLLNDFLDKHESLSGYPRVEFVDDGFTGTNTDRPSFQRMIDQVKKGELNLICVKDFSRFSRDYVEIGDYLECLFPFLGVRFISINDGYDSHDYKGTTGGLDVVMRNIVYAAYSKDLSVKVRSARDQRKKKGQYVESNVPFGYKRNPEDKHSLVIDPVSAPIVRRIFDLALEGTGAREIAKILNDDNTMTPAAYHKKKKPDTRQDYSVLGGRWSYSTVKAILVRETYKGTMISNKIVNTAPCSKSRKRQLLEECIVVEGKHPQIVSEEEFAAAQKVFKRNNQKKHESHDYPLKSLVRCGHCGRIMTRRVKGYGYVCRFRYDTEEACTEVHFETEKDLELLVFNAILLYIKGIEASSEDVKTFQEKQSSRIQALMEQLSSLQKREEHIRTDKLRLYESYAAGNLSRESYLRSKSSADEQIKAIHEEIAAYESDLAEAEHTLPEEKTMQQELAGRFSGQQELTNEMAKAFIDGVYIHADGHVEIRWKFLDSIPETYM